MSAACGHTRMRSSLTSWARTLHGSGCTRACACGGDPAAVCLRGMSACTHATEGIPCHAADIRACARTCRARSWGIRTSRACLRRWGAGRKIPADTPATQRCQCCLQPQDQDYCDGARTSAGLTSCLAPCTVCCPLHPCAPARLRSHAKRCRRPTAPQILEYLRAFADEFDLRRHIRFRTKVLCTELTPVDAGAPTADGAYGDGTPADRLNGADAQRWHVTSSPSDAGSAPEVVRCSAVLFSACSNVEP